MKIIYLKDENLENLIKGKNAIIDFYADWCGPCKMIGSVLEEIQEEIQIIKVNVDEHRELAIKYGVMSIPHLNFIKNGDIYKTEIGYREKEEILNIIEEMK